MPMQIESRQMLQRVFQSVTELGSYIPEKRRENGLKSLDSAAIPDQFNASR